MTKNSKDPIDRYAKSSLQDLIGVGIRDIVATLRRETFEPDYDNPGQEIRRIYLGDYLLTPSGKVYMPWATSNLEACPRCKGKDKTPTCRRCNGYGSAEAWDDECWNDRLEQIPLPPNVFLAWEDGDLFAIEVRDAEEAVTTAE